MRKTTLNRREIELRSPNSACIGWEVLALASSTSNLRAWGAALGICWADSNTWRLTPLFSSAGYSAARWGAQIVDELIARGCTVIEIQTAGQVALQLVSDSIAGGSAVKAAEDFSGAREDEKPGPT